MPISTEFLNSLSQQRTSNASTFRHVNGMMPACLAGLAAIAGKNDGAIGNADIGGDPPLPSPLGGGTKNRCVFEDQVHHVPPWP